MTQLQQNRKRRRTYTLQQQRDSRERIRYCRGGATARRLPTTVNVNGGDSFSSQQQSTGLSSTSSLLISRYSNRSSDTSDSNEDESTSARTTTNSYQSSTLGRANNSHQSPPFSQFSIDEVINDIDIEGALATAHDNHYIVDPDETELTWDQTFDMLDIGIVPFQDLHRHSKMKKMRENFLHSIYRQKRGNRCAMFHCPFCKHRWLDSRPASQRGPGRQPQCTECLKSARDNENLRILSSQNRMDPWPHLDFLKLPKLNDISQMLIAQVHPFMRVYRLEGGGVGYKGQVLNVEQDISNLVQELPLLPEEVPCFLVRKPNQSSPSGHRDFRVKRADIIAWLTFFKQNNPHYAHIDLDAAIQRASNLPEDGSIADSLRSVEFEEDDDDTDDNDESLHSQNEVTEQDLAPESGGASGEDSVPTIIDEYVTRPLAADQTEAQRNVNILRTIAPTARPPPQRQRQQQPLQQQPQQNNEPDEPIPWPEPGDFINDFNESSLISKAFPCLFPYGNHGDPTFKDRNHNITMDKAGKHFLKYCINMKDAQEYLMSQQLTEHEEVIVQKLYNEGTCPWKFPFVENDRFLHWMQNTTERHRSHGQRSFWLNKNSQFATMSPEEIDAIIRGGGNELKEILSSMQSFNANINGSPQYLYKKRKLLESLIEQKGICTEWFTLSMADNHWRDLHELLMRDGNGNATDFPTFQSVQEEASWKRKLVRDNLHIVDAYFYDRVQELFKAIHGSTGIEIDWHWFRIEYQGRGAPHVHGCLRLKRDPGIAKHAKIVLDGRVAALRLTKVNLLDNADDFELATCEMDTWDDSFMKGLEDVNGQEEIDILKEQIASAKVSHSIIIAYHDYFFTAENIQLPTDAVSDERHDDTFFDPKTSIVHHPSSINPLDFIHDEAAMEGLYCRNCNVQMRHKHQAYCDRNHAKREEAKQMLAAGTLGPRAKRPEDYPVDCRFDFKKRLRTKSHVFIEQNLVKKGDDSHVVTRIRLAPKRNDGWLNSHKRIILEVSLYF